jgi:hypothetical protein
VEGIETSEQALCVLKLLFIDTASHTAVNVPWYFLFFCNRYPGV